MRLGATLLAAAQPRTETRVEWLHAPEAWVILLLIVPATLLAVGWLYRGERGRLGALGRVLLATLRVALILSMVAFLCEPTLTRERVQTENPYILVVVDDSYSMGIADRYSDPEDRDRLQEVLGAPLGENTTRLDLVRALLERPDVEFLSRLRAKADLRVVSGSKGLKVLVDVPREEDATAPSPLPDLDGLELRGKVTQLGDSLYEAVNDLRGESVAAVVLFSDGRDNGGLLRPEEAASLLGRRDVPVHVVGVGNAEEPKDIRVFGLEIAEVVLEGDLVPVDFQVISEGFSGETVRVDLQLIRDDGVTGRSTNRFVKLEGGDEPQPVRMEFRPRDPGKYRVRVAVAHQEGELFKNNNADEKPVTVLSQKIRVLYVEGPPRWEYRYLMHALTRDPTMEARCLLASADDDFLQESSPGLKPIYRFPTTREELFEYHLVIIGDVAPEYFTAEQKEWLVEFVDDIGGGVIFMSGTWFMPQKYRGDPLEVLLPVVLEDSDPAIFDSSDLEDEFFLRLTPDGREHPVMQLEADPERNQEVWERTGRAYLTLPGFFWFAPVKTVKPGAVALAVHPESSHLKHGLRPIFAYQYLGRGRTFASLVDSTWRWRRGIGNRYFYRFWGQVIRFTSAGRLLGQTQRYSVSTDQREYTLGSQVRLLARILNEEFKPIKADQFPIRVEKLDEEGDGREQEITSVQSPSRPEFFEATLEARELGEHRVWIEDRSKEVASTSFRVVVPQVEYAEPRMDLPRLQQIAQLSGGSYHELYEAISIPEEIKAFPEEIPISSESESLWDSRWFLLLFIGVLTLEWILRKVYRLI